jgi:hypothetical protein
MTILVTGIALDDLKLNAGRRGRVDRLRYTRARARFAGQRETLKGPLQRRRLRQSGRRVPGQESDAAPATHPRCAPCRASP